MNVPAGLPSQMRECLESFTEASKSSFGPDLSAVVLYGSGAEGRVRASSDINLLVVLKQFDRSRVDQIRDPFRVAHAAIQMDIMFILESEIDQASEAFAVKFTDILARHCVLYGNNPFTNRTIPRDATLRRLRQVLLNLRLRLRERYALVSLREEQLAPIIADCAGPLRACAASILKLEGKSAASPREALIAVVTELKEPAWQNLLAQISEAREQLNVPAGTGGSVLFQLIALTGKLEERVQKLGK